MSLHEAMEFAPAEKDKMIQSWEASLHGDESTRAVSFDVSGKQMTYEITANSIKDSESIIGAIHIIRNITKRMNEQQELQQAYEKINHGMIDLQRSNEQITFLVEMSDLMLACNSVGELSDVVAKFCSKIFTLSSGMLYIMQPSKKYLEVSAQWGNIKSIENTIMTDQCWAIRLGRSHHAGSGKNELMCEHIKQQDNKTTYICVPLMAQNDIYGVLYLEIADDNSAEFAEKEKLLLKAFSELTALALANVRLRENLRNQSIRDPLTGLFNRRYLDDFLSKLLYQSERNDHHVVLLMLDIDYFKKVNDTHGHDAGDLVLKELSKVLEEEIRAGDLAARYGGEEFIIVFYNTTLDVATKRAEKIRLAVANLQIKQGTETLRITISIGIAEFPTHAKTAADLISLSDKALYSAKNGGRNRIVVYTESVNNI